jgi:hypothetical protein
MRSTAALVTLAIGNRPEFRDCLAFQRAYAARWGMDYVAITEARVKVRPNLLRKRRVGMHFEKFQLRPLLDQYARIVYLDADVLPTAHAPDILAAVEPGCWGCVEEAPGENEGKLAEEMRRFEKRLGALPESVARTPHFNAGVLVFDRSHAAIWDWDRAHVLPGRWPEQTLLNYRVRKHRCAVCFLDRRFNLTPLWQAQWADDDQRRNAFFVHYAGQAAKTRSLHDSPGFQQQWIALAGMDPHAFHRQPLPVANLPSSGPFSP